MCKYCEVLKSFDLEVDIRVKTKYWEFNKTTNESIEKDNWVTALTNLPIKYCPECGTKLK